MYSDALASHLRTTLSEIEAAGLYKRERLIDSTQNSIVRLKDGREVINMCANNYLGLADHPEVVAAAKNALDRWGFGMASVRFICGTQTLHKQLEEKISTFLGTEDTILYPSCFDANGGLFEVLLIGIHVSQRIARADLSLGEGHGAQRHRRTVGPAPMRES